MITIILKFWQEILITILLITVFGLYIGGNNKSKEIEILKSVNTQLKIDLAEANTQISTVRQAVENMKFIQREAEKKRAEIVAKMTQEINILRMQTPPKECSVAIEWAIENKSDLSWKK